MASAPTSQIQQVSVLGQVVKREAQHPLDMGAAIATVTVAAPTTAVAINAAVGEVTITLTTALAAGASLTAAMINAYITANSHVLCGIKTGTGVRTNGPSITIIPTGSGTAAVILANGGSGAFTDATLTYWFRVIQLA
jgi:hypothetical protein